MWEETTVKQLYDSTEDDPKIRDNRTTGSF